MSEEKKDANLANTAPNPLPETLEGRMEQIKSLILSTYHNLEKISHVVERIEQDQRRETYKSLPGEEGTFDGTFIVMEDGSKQEVPANYAAKSRLVFGDRLKIIEEDGKKVFKQIQKSDRKEIQGVLSKKEGRWYLLSEDGTYKISDVAADFNKAELNEKAVALVPADNSRVPFAALDKIIRNEVAETEIKTAIKPPVAKFVPTKPVKKTDLAPRDKVKKIEIKPATPKIEIKVQEKAEIKPAPQIPLAPKPETKKEFVANILEDDDLR